MLCPHASLTVLSALFFSQLFGLAPSLLQVVEEFTEAEKAEILRMANQPRLYERIVNSVAPTVSS